MLNAPSFQPQPRPTPLTGNIQPQQAGVLANNWQNPAYRPSTPSTGGQSFQMAAQGTDEYDRIMADRAQREAQRQAELERNRLIDQQRGQDSGWGFLPSLLAPGMFLPGNLPAPNIPGTNMPVTPQLDFPGANPFQQYPITLPGALPYRPNTQPQPQPIYSAPGGWGQPVPTQPQQRQVPRFISGLLR